MAATSGPQLVIAGGGFAGLFAARALDEMGTILWTAGIEAPPLAAAVAKATGAEQDRAGRRGCGKDLSLPGHPQILVTWDLMSLDKLPGVAEVAMQTGLYTGRRISHLSRGHAFDKPFGTTTRARPPTSHPGARSCPRRAQLVAARCGRPTVKQKESRS
jgi:NADH dehydrogenase FAD-containing subunit